MLHYQTVSPTLLNILQRLVALPEFSAFRLVGGTSLALQIGHRTSIDIDLFTDKEFDIRERQLTLIETFSSLEIIWQGLNGFSAQIDGVKTDIFNWRVPFTTPAINVDGIRMMDKLEIGAMMLDAITTRKEKKDFVDLFFLLDEFSIEDLLNSFRNKYPYMDYKFVLQSINAIAKADETDEPKMFVPLNWEEVKAKLTGEVERYVESLKVKSAAQQQDRLKNAEDLLHKKKEQLMLAKRIIPCLDIKDGRTVKGTNFINLRDAGDPVELAASYAQQGADELVFLDITATVERRKTLAELVKRVAHTINIPFTVGGGIKTVDDVSALLNNGADKISINTAAFDNPQIISAIAATAGSQCVVLAIDTKKEDDGEWYVYLHGGRTKTGTKCFDWAMRAVDLGAGEILLTSMNHDGTKSGFALDITKKLSANLPVPVIASGGGGTMEHFADVFIKAGADAALAASVFHFKEIEIPVLKNYLHTNGVAIRQ